MKIAHLVAGAAGRYCGSCLHGNTLVTALREAGQDAVLVPLYTPLRTDAPSAGLPRVAFGGLNVYLQQHWGPFRHMPGFLDRLFDHPRLLRWLGRLEGSTRPEQLGAMTVSMLRGEEGRQRKELRKLVHWLKHELRPEVVHLSTALVVGVARQLRLELGVPVVCTLSGEDGFLDALPEPYRDEARRELRGRCPDVSAFVAMNRYYADFMADYLAVGRPRIHVIPPGLNLTGYPASEEPDPSPSEASWTPPVTIGYFSRICPEKGLHLLAQAFRHLCAEPDLPPTRLRAAGYLHPSDRSYLEGIQRQMDRWGLGDRFHYAGEPDLAGKIAFLRSLDMMSVPTLSRQSKGLPILEAWACGVPVVLPDHGAFSEMVEATDGGLLFEPSDTSALAEALASFLRDPAKARESGRRARRFVRQHHAAALMARRTVELYASL